MKKILTIIGLVLMCFITSTFAITFENINVTTNTSNTTLSFDTPITVDSLDLGSDYIYLTNINTPSCYANTASYNFTGDNTTYFTSSFYSLFNCAEVNNQLQYDNNIGYIFSIGIVLFMLLLSFGATNIVDEEYQKYVVWFFIGLIALICLKIMFYP